MTKEVKMFTIVCDNCGVDAGDDAQYSCWNDKDYAEDVALDADWIKDNENHYCPNCHTHDDEDNLVINTLTQKP